MFPRMYHSFTPGLGAGEWIVMIISMVCILAIIVGVVLLIVWLVRRTSSGGRAASLPASPAEPTARDILQTRYARGEITREQYQEMLADLNQPLSP